MLFHAQGPMRLARVDADAALYDVHGLLLRSQSSVSSAESCTSGLVAVRLTQLGGSSAYFKGGVLAYTEKLKVEWVGVPAALIAGHGVVSEEVAVAMAEGVREKTETTFGIGITGFAGPGGGTEANPVGTVYIALAHQDKETLCVRLSSSGDRDEVREDATMVALCLLRDSLKEWFSRPATINQVRTGMGLPALEGEAGKQEFRGMSFGARQGPVTLSPEAVVARGSGPRPPPKPAPGDAAPERRVVIGSPTMAEWNIPRQETLPPSPWDTDSEKDG